MTNQEPRMLHPHPGQPGHLVVSLHGVLNADTAQRIADQLIAMIAADTRQLHLDVDQVNPLSAAAAAVLLFAVLRAAGGRDPAVTLTVHRASERTAAHLRELGLDRLLTTSDEPA